MVTEWYNFVCDVCSADMLCNLLQLNSTGHVVVIDETNHKPSNARAWPVPQQWVFGGSTWALALFSWS